MNSPFVTRNITLQAKDKNRETSQENKQGTKTKGVAILRKIQKKSASIKIETVNKTGRQIKKNRINKRLPITIVFPSENSLSNLSFILGLRQEHNGALFTRPISGGEIMQI